MCTLYRAPALYSVYGFAIEAATPQPSCLDPPVPRPLRIHLEAAVHETGELGRELGRRFVNEYIPAWQQRGVDLVRGRVRLRVRANLGIGIG